MTSDNEIIHDPASNANSLMTCPNCDGNGKDRYGAICFICDGRGKLTDQEYAAHYCMICGKELSFITSDQGVCDNEDCPAYAEDGAL